MTKDQTKTIDKILEWASKEEKGPEKVETENKATSG